MPSPRTSAAVNPEPPRYPEEHPGHDGSHDDAVHGQGEIHDGDGPEPSLLDVAPRGGRRGAAGVQEAVAPRGHARVDVEAEPALRRPEPAHGARAGEPGLGDEVGAGRRRAPGRGGGERRGEGGRRRGEEEEARHGERVRLEVRGRERGGEEVGRAGEQEERQGEEERAEEGKREVGREEGEREEREQRREEEERQQGRGSEREEGEGEREERREEADERVAEQPDEAVVEGGGREVGDGGEDEVGEGGGEEGEREGEVAREQQRLRHWGQLEHGRGSEEEKRSMPEFLGAGNRAARNAAGRRRESAVSRAREEDGKGHRLPPVFGRPGMDPVFSGSTHQHKTFKFAGTCA